MDIAVTQDQQNNGQEATPSFETAMHELEEIVTVLERGNIPLEQQIALVRRGMALAEQCDTTLAQAEATLEQLIATADGELITQPIDYDDGEDEDMGKDE